jgi:pyruvate dehydrogenase E2 component (dihydrolipoamide acetyltransferase)
MPTVDMVMPKMGESVQEGTVIEWKVKVGDRVEKDQILLDIATDKVDTEVPSPASGIITEILAGPDVTVVVGAPIARISSGADAAAAPANPVPAKPASAPAAPAAQVAKAAAPAPVAAPAPKPASAPAASGGATVDMVMPKMGESVQEGTVIAWKVKVGDKVEKDQILLEIATDKVDTEVPSPATGTLTEILAGPDVTVVVGAPIARIARGSGAAAAPASAPAPSVPAARPAAPSAPAAVQAHSASAAPSGPLPRRDGERFYSPLVRKIATEHNISADELRHVTGTGTGGRVSRDNLLAYLSNRTAAPVTTTSVPARAATPTAAPSAAPATSAAKLPGGLGVKRTIAELGLDPNRVRTEKLNFMRKKIASHMRESLDTSAHVYSVHEIDMTPAWELRDAVKDEFKKEYGFGLTFTSFIIWAAARALRQYPWVNARLNGDEIIFHDYVNIGMAVALPDNGLVVPKIRDAENLTITGIQRKVNDLGERARDGKLNPDELSGGTFTITNMGSGGTLIGLPVISQPEVAILGVGAIQQRPVCKNGGILPRHMMYVSLSYDHRLVDGMLAAKFLTAVTESLEKINPVHVGLDRRKS